ncbi:MAG: ATPase domain-containing protein [Candidatus Nanohaloarchaea archaeon]|nr:ATPase domain-containing protein [Candidatus Nanohaloarchaea archaeon]
MGTDDVPRVSSGVKGLDNLIEGGFPKGSVTLISGGAGCGKTIFCNQYLWDGLQEGEKVRYISLEEPVDDIMGDAEVFGWEFRDYEEDGQFKIDYIKPSSGSRGFIDKINEMASEEGVSRLVIDSISVMLGAYGGTQAKKRDNLYDLLRNIKRAGPTTLLTSEIPENDEKALSRFGVSEFVADGVVVLYYTGVGEGTFRNLEVRKMRRTDHTPGTHPFQITDQGINLTSEAGF